MSGTIVVIHFETVLMLESQQSPPRQGHTIRSLDNTLEAINGPTASCRVCGVYSGTPTKQTPEVIRYVDCSYSPV